MMARYEQDAYGLGPTAGPDAGSAGRNLARAQRAVLRRRRRAARGLPPRLELHPALHQHALLHVRLRVRPPGEPGAVRAVPRAGRRLRGAVHGVPGPGRSGRSGRAAAAFGIDLADHGTWERGLDEMERLLELALEGGDKGVTGLEGLGQLRPPRPRASRLPADRGAAAGGSSGAASSARARGCRPSARLSTTLGVSRMTLRQVPRSPRAARSPGARRRARDVVAAPKVEQDLRALRTYPDELRGQGVESSTDLLRVRDRPRAGGGRGGRARPGGGRGRRIASCACAAPAGVPLLLETAWLDAAALPDLLGAGSGGGRCGTS